MTSHRFLRSQRKMSKVNDHTVVVKTDELKLALFISLLCFNSCNTFIRPHLGQ